jgi:DNA-binding beta-propeller fold protein YncE
LKNPQGISVDASNNTYVLDAGNGRVQVFDAQGNVRSAFGAFGTRLGELGDYKTARDSAGRFARSP